MIQKIKDWWQGLRCSQSKHVWAIQTNKNDKPFKRTCCGCGLINIRTNGKWVGGSRKLHHKNGRF